MEIFRNGGVMQPTRQNFPEYLRLARPIRVSLICRTRGFASNIIKISQVINAQTPQTKIYIQTVLPIEKEKFKNNILKVNEIIKANEKDNPYQIIDLYSIFVNENGLIKKDLSNDGIHLNEKGYEAWVDFIKPVVSSID